MSFIQKKYVPDDISSFFLWVMQESDVLLEEHQQNLNSE